MTQWGLDTLFNPAKRHMDEEKRRLQSTREEVGDNSGGKRIDFETGKVVIHRSGDDTAATDTTGGATAGPDGAATDPINAADDTRTAAEGDAGKPVDRKKSASAGPTAAQLRAAKRRGRTPR